MVKPIDYTKPEVQEVVRSQVRGFFKRHLGDGLHFVECLLGKHEPEDELYKDIPFNRKTEMLSVKETVCIRKCKHCKCLYVEET
jgi:hypothetical protein